MAIELSQIKFAKSEESGELIGFVSKHSKTKKLKGVRENSTYGKKICVLSDDLKGLITENVLYNVELKPMHNNNGYVVVSAKQVFFKARVETHIIEQSVYQVHVIFGNKRIYFDPIKGKSISSSSIEGVVNVLKSRSDIENVDMVIDVFKGKAQALLEILKNEGNILRQ